MNIELREIYCLYLDKQSNILYPIMRSHFKIYLDKDTFHNSGYITRSHKPMFAACSRKIAKLPTPSICSQLLILCTGIKEWPGTLHVIFLKRNRGVVLEK
ncbi:hypothetical protein EYC80_001825 [Monilinia laxa]|uniref:Uncharacterized protein n=1 Tax=Monilinia laxa TaxID=61186 RepID=A0A5N6K690_MONLA|nr:hypothetical protein EYC80_001825 [Monilinia laxa]